MTMSLDLPLAETGGEAPSPLPVVDLYRDIHKGIRSELFAIASTAGHLDPDDHGDRAALHDHIVAMAGVLESHAHHEDVVIDPVLAVHLPDLAVRIQHDHVRIERRFEEIVERAADLVRASASDRRPASHHLYLELADFTGAYLTHQDLEERTVMPALEAAVGAETTHSMFVEIVESIPPDEMARSLAFMLPAMNVLDRVEMLEGIRASAPPPAFETIVGLARSVLTPIDFDQLVVQLGL